MSIDFELGHNIMFVYCVVELVYDKIILKDWLPVIMISTACLRHWEIEGRTLN